LLRLMVQNINGLENVPHLNGKGGEVLPQFREFAAMAHTMGRLQHEGLLQLSDDPIPVALGDMSEPLRFAGDKKEDKDKEGGLQDIAIRGGTEFKASDMLAAAASKSIYHRLDANTIVLRKQYTVHDMHLAPDAWHDGDLIAAAHDLKLTPGLAMYRLMPPEAGLFRRQFEPQGSDLVVSTRSVLQTMSLLAKGVEVPEKHFKEGLVPPPPLDTDGMPFDWTQVTQGLFHVCVSKTRPKHAFVAIKHRGYWFYIPDNDWESKSTFDLVLEMHNVQITPGCGGTPILTGPVGASSGSGGGGGGGGGKKGG
jgi:hypothetical protein